ncbi:MAG: Sec-independent protein translocase protein TatB [Thermomicrobiales bacterium]
MFGIGYQEMFVILVVALVVFGPARLPELAGQVGRWVRDFRRMSSDLTGEFEKTFAEVEDVKRTIKREMQAIQDEVEGTGKSTRADLKKSTARTAASTKKPSEVAKSGSATKSVPGKSSTGSTGTNGVRTKMPALDASARGKKGKDTLALPVATKQDPLADVSFFNLDADFDIHANGSANGKNGAEEASEALERVRRRRVAASYARRTGV